MDNVDAYLSPRLPTQQGQDHWRPLGTGGNGGGAHGFVNNGASEGRPF